MAKVHQHHPLPPSAPAPRHNSGGVTSTPAGGQVPVDQYWKPVPISQGGGGPVNDDARAAIDRGEPDLV